LKWSKAFVDVSNSAGNVVQIMRSDGEGKPFGVGRVTEYWFAIGKRRGGSVFGYKPGGFLDEDNIVGVFISF